jgi:hypothetical protein
MGAFGHYTGSRCETDSRLDANQGVPLGWVDHAVSDVSQISNLVLPTTTAERPTFHLSPYQVRTLPDLPQQLLQILSCCLQE